MMRAAEGVFFLRVWEGERVPVFMDELFIEKIDYAWLVGYSYLNKKNTIFDNFCSAIARNRYAKYETAVFHSPPPLCFF